MNAINYRESWTLELDQELIRRHNEGQTDQEIADGMGRTRVGIINRRIRLNIAHGQRCSRKREQANSFMFSGVRFEDVTKEEARAIQRWALCPDYEYPNVNLLKITPLPNPKKP